MSHVGFEIIELAKQNLLRWAKEKSLPIHGIEFVATFEEWDDGIGVWVFYENESDLGEGNENGISKRIKTKYLSLLKEYNYPFKKFPKVGFEFDSHENVVKNFQGNYFYRLR